MPIRTSPSFGEAAWVDDRANLSASNQGLAQAIFDYATNKLRSEVHHRKNKNKKGRDWETIFRVEGVERFWLVISTSKSKLKLIFPDKKDRIASTDGFRVDLAQWDRKREKRAEIDPFVGEEGFDALRGIIEQIHANALEYYEETEDFTERLTMLFGESRGGETLQVPTEGDLASLLHSSGACCICGETNRLSVASRDTEWRLYCDAHHPNRSPWTAKGQRGIPFEVREIVWHRDGGKCVACGSTGYLTFDHLIPANRGGKYPFSGSHLETNIRLKCWKCNSSKSDNLIP